MSHRRYQTLAATGAAVTGLAATTCAFNGLWWETGFLAFGSVFLVEAAARESRAHRDACARERMARGNDQGAPLPLVPCCAFWVASETRGRIHTTTCHTWSDA